MAHRVPEGLDRLAGERAAGKVGDRAGDHHRQLRTLLAEDLLDRDDRRTLQPRLLKLDGNGTFAPVAGGDARDWGRYLRYRYVRFDFSRVTTPGTYAIEYGGTRTAPRSDCAAIQP